MNYAFDPSAFEVLWDFFGSRTYGAYLRWRTDDLVVVTFIMSVLATLQAVMDICTAVLALRIFCLAVEGEVWPNGRAFDLTTLYNKFYTPPGIYCL
ncbi:hypothetical protein C8F04DRAFT_1396311 [Mycena alexandri]|uniref:Uncharacterized protein n=1 Tax=Mycena alexandri TaxID=1745969 RepID=A0AAD6SS53_9AGAR|nr:hypothetical protein C8F04DRAFT_1396311 [Mycena alexandri]